MLTTLDLSHTQDVVLSLLAASRRWPSQPGHGIEFKDFELRHAQLFKGLAQHYGCATLLPTLLPPLLALMQQPRRDAQAVAAEALSGLVRGAGRWTLSEQRSLWEAVTPALRAALRACSVQSLGDWQACLRFIAFNRDPRRLSWLVTMLLEELEGTGAGAAPSPATPPEDSADVKKGGVNSPPEDLVMVEASAAVKKGGVKEGGGAKAAEGGAGDASQETSLAQANHLRFLAPLVVELGWRGHGLIRRVLRSEKLRQWVCHPYRHVREEVGSLVAICADACSPPPRHHPAIGAAISAEVDAFVTHLLGACLTPEGGLLVSTPKDATMEAGAAAPAEAAAVEAAAAAAAAAAVEFVLEPEDAATRDLARAARETTLRLVTHSAMQGRGVTVAALVPRLIPPVMWAASSMQRPDLANAARSCAVLMAGLSLEGAATGAATSAQHDAMELLSTRAAMSAQHDATGGGRAPLFGEVLSTLSQLAGGGSWRLRGGLLPFLALAAYRGQFIEPASTHAMTLREILHRLLADPQHEVREATAMILAGFVRLRGPAERAATLRWARQCTRKGKPLAERHAGVLALVALMQLAPYDVPAWLPEVLELLGSFHTEPQPIKQAVSKAFADFKRTHQDDWVSHRERFTPEQQDLIADMLVSPSFYA